MKKLYIAAYHQSKFGKLLAMTVPEIIAASIDGACRAIGIDADALDTASIGAACNFSLNEQGLLAGLVAMHAGMAAKPIEAVENACASGGQAVVSVAQKLQLGHAETGIAIGYEKMRDDAGKMDGKLIGKVLGYFSHPDERVGRTFVFPHIFAEIMRDYMAAHGVTERELAEIAAREYANARANPWAQMRDNHVTTDDVMRIEGFNRYVVDGLPLKTYDCSQITDGYAALILATAEGVARLGLRIADCIELAGYGQATDAIARAGRDVLRPTGARQAMQTAYRMAHVEAKEVNVAEVHDCFSVMGAIGAEVIGKAEVGAGARYWNDGKAQVDGECGINLSGGLIAKGHPVGATGVAMIGWCALQLWGKAPDALQVENARFAATFNIGGPVCASVCTVLKAPH